MTLLGQGSPALVVDVGGTDTKFGEVDTGGSMRVLDAQPTPRGADAAERVVAMIASFAARDASAKLGVVLPGIVDTERGVGVFSENLGWRDVPFGSMLADATGREVALGHDVGAAAIAELRFGAARGARDAAVVVIGTGISAGIVIDGKLRRVAGYAGEIGHTIVPSSTEPCVCGARGCLEATASAAAIARIYRRVSGNAAAGARDVLDAATAGDRHAQRVWQGAVVALAEGLRQLCALTAPERIVVGGGLASAGDALMAPLRDEVERTFTVQRVPEIVLARAGKDAGLLGAAALARGIA